jgi:hypothetical protein
LNDFPAAGSIVCHSLIRVLIGTDWAAKHRNQGGRAAGTAWRRGVFQGQKNYEDLFDSKRISQVKT